MNAVLALYLSATFAKHCWLTQHVSVVHQRPALKEL